MTAWSSPVGPRRSRTGSHCRS